MQGDHDPHHQAEADLVGKGLSEGAVGLFGGTVLGISSVAPAYALTATIGILVAEAGTQDAGDHHRGLPADVLRRLRLPGVQQGRAGLRHLVHLDDQGLRPVRRLAGRLGGDPRHDHRAVEPRRRRGAVLLPVPRRPAGHGLDQRPVGEPPDQRRSPAWSSSRSRPGSPTGASPPPSGSRSCWCCSSWWCWASSRSPPSPRPATPPTGISFDLDWFSPAGLTLSAFIAGLSGSIFAFWGWDTALTVNEESKDSDKTPGRAALLCVVSILLTYLLVAVSLQMYAGVGTDGTRTGQRGDLRQRLRCPRPAGARPAARPGAVPRRARLQRREPDHDVPADLAHHAGDGHLPRLPAASSRPSTPCTRPRRTPPSLPASAPPSFYSVLTFVSERVLTDTIYSLGIMICFYYGLTAFACIWYFRHELFDDLSSIVFKLLFPLLGGLGLTWVFAGDPARQRLTRLRERRRDRRRRAGADPGPRPDRPRHRVHADPARQGPGVLPRRDPGQGHPGADRRRSPRQSRPVSRRRARRGRPRSPVVRRGAAWPSRANTTGIRRLPL